MSKSTQRPLPATPKSDQDPWPRLDIGGGAETNQSLLFWGQILGKTRLALSPMVNHWWQVSLRLTARGLTTTPMPVDHRVLDVELDVIDHRLVARTSDGGVESMSLCDQPLSTFYADYMRLLAKLGVKVEISPIVGGDPGPRAAWIRTRASAATTATGRIDFSARSSRPIGCSRSSAGDFWERPARSTSSGGRAIWRRRASRGALPRCIRAGFPTSGTR